MRCIVCYAETKAIHRIRVLGKYEGILDYCAQCGFLNMRDPVWIEESYSETISSSDTGVVQRNINLSADVSLFLRFILGERGSGKYLDYAGGYGLLTRLMRDNGFDFFWDDPYCQNLMARGYEFRPNLPPFSAVTAFEVLEHATDPLALLREIMSRTQTRTVICSTVLYGVHPPAPNEWWYYSLNTGQHISFYNRKTLEVIGGTLGLRFYSNGCLHVFTDKTINRLFFRLICNRFTRTLSPPFARIIFPRSRTTEDRKFQETLRCSHR